MYVWGLGGPYIRDLTVVLSSDYMCIRQLKYCNFGIYGFTFKKSNWIVFMVSEIRQGKDSVRSLT